MAEATIRETLQGLKDRLEDALADVSRNRSMADDAFSECEDALNTVRDALDDLAFEADAETPDEGPAAAEDDDEE
jgi:hypothetical protein